jgi:ubiquitin conjugation factor E4 B
MLCRILLSDAMDPLTRTPLKEEDLIPDAALKTRIEAWKAEMRQKAFERARQQ